MVRFILLSVWLVGLASRTEALPAGLETDAEILAAGGVDLFGRLRVSPGTPRELRPELAFGIAAPHVGLGMQAASCELQITPHRFAASFGCSVLHTPVGELVAPAIALQARGGRWHLGIGCEARNWRFAGYPGMWEYKPSVGLGLRPSRTLELATRFEPSPGAPLCVAGALQLALRRGLWLAVQQDRIPGQPARWHFGAHAEAGAVDWRAGFDAGTAAVSLGCTWRGPDLRVAWGARSHPDLGWSHAWGLVLSRAPPSRGESRVTPNDSLPRDQPAAMLDERPRARGDLSESTDVVEMPADLEDDSQPDLEDVANLDALLVDPVDLTTSDRERLILLPWLGPAEIGALRAAPPPRDLEALARLPGWDAILARRTAPFVRFARPERFAPRPVSNARLSVTAGPRTWRGRMQVAGVEAGWWSRMEDATATSGFSSLASRHGRVVAGDVRFGFGEGLVAWTSAVSTHARSGWRHARGLIGALGSSPRTLRGGGFELERTHWQMSMLAGRNAAGEAALVALGLHPRRQLRMQLATVATQRDLAASAAFAFEVGAARTALEVAATAAGIGTCAAAELRVHAFRCGARIQVLPPIDRARLAGLGAGDSRGRSAQLWCSHALHGFETEAGLVAVLGRDAEAGRRERFESFLGIRRRIATNSLELHFARTNRFDEAWVDPSSSELAADGRTTLRARIVRPFGPEWSGRLQVDDVTRLRGAADALQRSHGRAWSVRVERRRGWLRPGAAIASHVVDAGLSLVPPALDSRLPSPRMNGDGVLAAAALRFEWRGVSAAGSLVGRAAAGRAFDVTTRWSAAFRWPAP